MIDYIKEIKEIVEEQVYEQLKHNFEHVNTKELGEAVDMIKDAAEAAYYCSVVEAMEEAKEEDKHRNGDVVYYTERYLPYPDRDMREKYIDQKYNGDRRYMPYYDYNEPVARDLREGRSPRVRRMYMEDKEHHQSKEVQLKDLETYMSELSQDVTEMIADSTPEEKTMLHKKLLALTNKIETLINNK